MEIEQPLSSSSLGICARDFGTLLRQRREAARLSQSELARRARLTRGTVHNIEEGLTEPSPTTLRRLRGLTELRLDAVDLGGAEAGWQLGSWLSPKYDPVALAADMTALLNGPGGTLEQTYQYLDAQSAADWLRYCSEESYVSSFRDKVPAQQLAQTIAGRLGGRGLDINALGVGDGRTETRLVQALLTEVTEQPDLRMYLVDISHPLLVTAFKHAASLLAASRVPVFPVHGNFYEVSRIVPLHYQPPGSTRRRLWTMFGNTFGNLPHEPSLLADLYACTSRGDMLLLDVQLVWAPAEDMEAVRAADPALRRPLPERIVQWLSGPLLRHCRGVRSVRLSVDSNHHCPLPGSYELVIWADVRLERESRRFAAWRIRRYDLHKLAATLGELGWRKVLSHSYGPEPKRMGVMLCERI